MICSKNKCICTENTNCDACKSNPCLNGAVCKPSGLSYECICPNGWNGTNCQQETNECSAFNPCKRGICTSKKGEPYKCYCEPGFTGLHCDIDVDECLSKPCKNGATCVNQVRLFFSFIRNEYYNFVKMYLFLKYGNVRKIIKEVSK